MNNKRDWEKFRHILTLYRCFCNNCGQDVASKNGIETKPHYCISKDRNVSLRPIPFCIICMGMLSLKPKKLEKHYIPHAALFKNSVFFCGGAYSQVLYDLLFSDFEDTVSSKHMNFQRSNEAVQKNLTDIISPRFPKVRVFTYGSREIGTGTQNSDLDMYVDTDQSYHIHGLDKSVMKTLEEVSDILKANPDVWDNIHVINAKIPIIEVFNKNEKIKCDISFSDGIGHCNTLLIKKLCDRQPILRQMIIFLGHWLDIIELSGHITKYTLRLLIINYLQCNGLLPSIKAIQKNISKPTKIGEWIVDFDESKIIQKKTGLDDLEHHIKGFFKKYRKAKAFHGILSTYVASKIPFTQFTINKFKNYKKFLNKYGNSEAYVIAVLNVQGPFNLAANPAKQVSKKHLEKFISLSSLSFRLLNMRK